MSFPDFTAPEAKLRRQLLAGRDRELWEQCIGAAEYRRLRELALQARSAARGAKAARGRVYILPGIMGSRLAVRRPGGSSRRLLWIDPDRIGRGELRHLACTPASRLGIRPAGAMAPAYLKLKLTLEVAGFEVRFHDYDWRQDIGALGEEFAERLLRARRPALVVAHSMGGLVSRAALHAEPRIPVRKFLLLATPNFGSFAPVLALRGVYPAVRAVAALEPRLTARELTRQVFATFPGLYGMLPAVERSGGCDLFDPANWPDDDLAPKRALLRRARRMRGRLAPADERFTLIAGVGQDTVTGVKRSRDGFVYRITRNGDGTVPLRLAVLPGVRTYHVEEIHGSIPANGLVCSAVRDLLLTGRTARLPTGWRPLRGQRAISESVLRRWDESKRSWTAMSAAERCQWMRELILPSPTTT